MPLRGFRKLGTNGSQAHSLTCSPTSSQFSLSGMSLRYARTIEDTQLTFLEDLPSYNQIKGLNFSPVNPATVGDGRFFKTAKVPLMLIEWHRLIVGCFETRIFFCKASDDIKSNHITPKSL